MNAAYFEIMRAALRQSSGRIHGNWCPLHYFQACISMAGRKVPGRMPHERIILGYTP